MRLLRTNGCSGNSVEKWSSTLLTCGSIYNSRFLVPQQHHTACKKIKNIAASSDGGPKLSVQPPRRWHPEKGAQRAHAFTVTLWQSGFN